MLRTNLFGVENVLLKNGYIHQVRGVRSIRITGLDGANECFTGILINLPRGLSGEELRFLRKFIELPLHDAAKIFQRQAAEIALMENNRRTPCPRDIDFFIRKEAWKKFYNNSPKDEEILACITKNIGAIGDEVVLIRDSTNNRWIRFMECDILPFRTNS